MCMDNENKNSMYWKGKVMFAKKMFQNYTTIVAVVSNAMALYVIAKRIFKLMAKQKVASSR